MYCVYLTVINAVMNRLVLWSSGNFLTCCGPVSRILLHAVSFVNNDICCFHRTWAFRSECCSQLRIHLPRHVTAWHVDCDVYVYVLGGVRPGCPLHLVAELRLMNYNCCPLLQILWSWLYCDGRRSHGRGEFDLLAVDTGWGGWYLGIVIKNFSLDSFIIDKQRGSRC